MDYNTQRKIVKALAEKGKNPLLFLPCLIARVLVAAFMSAWRFVDMALSDKEGNFLGIKRQGRKSSARRGYGEREARREERRLQAAIERAERSKTAVKVQPQIPAASVMDEDGFSERELRRIRGSLPYRSFGARCASFGLAAAFALMVIPEISAGAAVVGDSASPWVTFKPVSGSVDKAVLTEFYFERFGDEPAYITEADLYSGIDYDNDVLNVAGGTFNDIPTLTMVTLGYSADLSGNPVTSISNNNFRNSGGGDVAVFVKGRPNDGGDSEEAIKRQLGGTGVKVIRDDSGGVRNTLLGLGTVPAVSAKGSIGSVIVDWTPASSGNGELRGYAIYSAKTKRDPMTGREYISEFKRVNYYYPAATDSLYPEYTVVRNAAGETKCRAVIPVTASEQLYYAVRPFMERTSSDTSANNGIYQVCAPLFAVSNDTAAPVTPSTTAPVITADVSGFDVTLNITNVDPKANYINIYCTESKNLDSGAQENYSEYTWIGQLSVPSANGRYTLKDPAPLGAAGRKYVAVMVYDVLESFKADRYNNYRDFLKNVEDSNTALAVPCTMPYRVDGPNLIPPESFFAYVYDGKLRFTWEDNRNPWYNIPDGTIAYQITVDGKVVNADSNNGLISGTNFVEVNAEDYLNGDTAIAQIRTCFVPSDSSIEMRRSDPLSAEIDLNAPQIKSAKPGNGSFVLEWIGIAGETSYTIHWQSVVGSSTGSKVINAASAETAIANEYRAEVTGVSNITYEVWVTADNVSNSTPSAKIRVTPSTAPPAPYNLTAETADKTVTLMWDGEAEEYIVMAYTNNTGTGTPVRTIEGIRERTCKLEGLDNGRTYSFRVWSVKKVEGEPILSDESAFTTAVPYPNVAMVNSILVVPQDITIKLSWNAADGANKYYIKKICEDGEQEIFSVGSVTEFEDGSVKNNKLYTYSVMGVTESDGKDYPQGDEYFSVPQSGKINVYVPAVQGLTAEADDGKVTLKWEKVDKADGYIIRLYENGQWREITRVSDTKFEHTGLINEREYQYQVTAYRMVNLGREIVESTAVSPSASATAGRHFPAPLDFTVTAGDGLVNLAWAAVDDAEGYEIQVADIYGGWHSFDVVTKNSAVHAGLSNGAVITYRVRAFKTVSGERVYSDFTLAKTAVVGTYLNAPTDLVIKTSDKQVDISWKAVDGAEGYVVYSYNPTTSSFTPVGIVTGTSFSHTGLVNGRTYTYMVAAYKTVNGEIRYSPYSLSATAVPDGTGSTVTRPGTNGTNLGEYRIFITGTTPYGMSNSNLISAFAESGAFNEDIDVRFTWSAETTTTVQDVLDFYGEGLENFMVYPMDISLYKAGTDQKVNVNAGYYLTLTIPVPDELLPYSEGISVVHISNDGQLEILPSTHVTVSGADCMQFQATSFSPYAFVVYMPQNGEDFAAGGFAVSSASMQYQTSAAPVLMCTSLPSIYGRRRRNKVYRIVK